MPGDISFNARSYWYENRSLIPAENKQNSSKLEFLAVKWTVYVYYTSHFKIYSDIPVTEITITGRMSATGQRWVNELAEFKSSIHYSPGKQMYF